jgi:hypothetical protein
MGFTMNTDGRPAKNAGIAGLLMGIARVQGYRGQGKIIVRNNRGIAVTVQ